MTHFHMAAISVVSAQDHSTVQPLDQLHPVLLEPVRPGILCGGYNQSVPINSFQKSCQTSTKWGKLCRNILPEGPCQLLNALQEEETVKENIYQLIIDC